MKHILYEAIIILFLLCLVSLPGTSQEKIYGAKKLISKSGFSLTVVERNHHCWCNCISWLIEWLRNNFKGSCTHIRFAILTDDDADCALEKLGFSRMQIKKAKNMDERSQLDYLISEIIKKNIFGFGISKNIISSGSGITISINLSGF